MELLDREGGVALHDADELDHVLTPCPSPAPRLRWGGILPHHRAASLVSPRSWVGLIACGGVSIRRHRRLSRWSNGESSASSRWASCFSRFGGIAELLRPRVAGCFAVGGRGRNEGRQHRRDRVRSRARKLETDPLAVRAGRPICRSIRLRSTTGSTSPRPQTPPRRQDGRGTRLGRWSGPCSGVPRRPGRRRRVVERAEARRHARRVGPAARRRTPRPPGGSRARRSSRCRRRRASV